MTEEQAKELLKQREQHLDNINAPKEMFTADITDGEIKSLGKVDVTGVHKITDTDFPAMGYKNLPIDNLPSKGLFYPEGTKISIRAAQVKEIRHFSTVDENDYLDGDDKLNFIIENCAKIEIPNKYRSGWKDLQDMDRLYIIYSIRELTFKTGENKLTMNVNCQACGHSETIELTKDRLNFWNLDERLMRYYDPIQKGFLIKTKDGSQFPLYLPTLGVATFIKNYIRGKAQSNQYYDKTFVRMAPFLFNDWRLLSDKVYNDKDQETYGYNHKKLSVISGLIDIIAKSVSPDVPYTCTSCGSEGSAPLDFQGGFKSLFLYSDIFDELA